MRQLILLVTLLVALLVPMFSSAIAAEQELTVPELVIGVEVNKKDRTVDGAGTNFASDVGKLVCFSRVLGAEKQTQIYHVWYYGGRTIAKIPLQIKSRSWRTWSTKKILPGWTGDWVVKVLDGDGLVIASQKFKITDVADAPLKQENE